MAISICGATLKPFKGHIPAYAIAAELSGAQYMVYIYMYTPGTQDIYMYILRIWEAPRGSSSKGLNALGGSAQEGPHACGSGLGGWQGLGGLEAWLFDGLERFGGLVAWWLGGSEALLTRTSVESSADYKHLLATLKLFKGSYKHLGGRSKIHLLFLQGMCLLQNSSSIC